MNAYLKIADLWALTIVPLTSFSQQSSFYEKERGWRRAYYLKPVIGWFGQKTAISGDAQFQKLNDGPTYNPPYGLLIGYRQQAIEVETGLLRLPTYAGFFFPSLVHTDSFLGFSKRNTTYYGCIPIKVRYNRAFQHRKFLIGLAAGVAYNKRDTSFEFGNPATTITGVRNKDGTEISVKSVTYTYYKTTFFSGEVGVTGLWQLYKRFGISLEAKQLFSASDIVRLSSTVEQNSSPTIYKVLATGGANGQSVLLGASYYF